MNGTFAALKQVEINDESDLEDYSVEIDILSQCKHHNVVGLHEAFYYKSKLWVPTTLHYITFHYITLHYITLHYITLHYITLHYITLHYFTLPSYMCCKYLGLLYQGCRGWTGVYRVGSTVFSRGLKATVQLKWERGIGSVFQFTDDTWLPGRVLCTP